MLIQQNEEAKAVREDYLAKVSVRLAGRLSPLEAFESVQEMREHVDAMAAVYEEVGLEPVDAMTAALAKFGEAEQIGKVYASSVRQLAPLENGLGLATVIAAESLIASIFILGCDISQLSPFQHFPNFGPDVAAGGVAGLIIGYWAYKNRLRPAAFALVVCVLMNALLYGPLYKNYGNSHFVLQIALILNLGAIVMALAGTRLASKVRFKESKNLKALN